MHWSLFKIVGWFFIWILIWTVTIFFRKKHQENCLTWATKNWDEKGGYLVIRWCRSIKYPNIRWPHFLWLPADKHHDLEHIIPNTFDKLSGDMLTPWFDPVPLRGDEMKGPNVDSTVDTQR